MSEPVQGSQGGAGGATVVIPDDMGAFAPQVDRLIDGLDALDLQRACSYTLADAIREGCGASKQAYGWGDADTACTLSAAAAAAIARGYL